MSPEQALARPVDARTDLFSLGTVLYEMVTGRKAFTGDSTAAIFDAILNREPTPVAQINPQAPFEIEQVIGKALSKDVRIRYQTAADMAADLLRLRQQSGTSRATAPSVSAASAPGVPQEPSSAEASEVLSHAEVSAARSATQLPPATSDSTDVSGSSSTIAAIDQAGARHWKGLLAVVLVLGIGAAAYFAFRGTAEPVLEEGTEVVLADFVNTTGDDVFDGTLRQALAVKIAESPYLDVYPQDKMIETLELMERSTEEKVTPEVAREICQRRGVKAMLSGEVANLGANFIVTLNAIDCGTGELLVGEQVEATSKEQVLAALGTAVTRMRGQLGESLASVEKYDVPIEQATTPSLEALEAFSQAAEQRMKGRDFQAIPFFERAIELDPGFALAHGRLGTAYNNTNQNQKAHEHWQRAYELVDGVSEPERLYILAHYYNSLLGDRRKGAEIYEQWISVYPRDWTPHNNLAVSYNFMGQFDRELEHAREAVRLGGNNLFARSNLTLAYSNLGRVDEAKEFIAETLAQGFSEEELAFDLAYMAAHDRDLDGVRSALEPWTSTPSEPFKLFLVGNLEAAAGRLAESRALSRRETELAANYSGDEGVAQAKLNMAYRLLAFGYVDEPARLAREAIELARDLATLQNATAILSRLGDPAEVGLLIDELAERWPQNTFTQEVFIPSARASLALRAGDADEALHVLETPRPFEQSHLTVIELRGKAYLAAGRPAEAVAELERLVLLDHVFPFWEIHSLAHLWLARAHLANGDEAAARAAYETFLELMANADEGIPEIEKARQEYSTIPGASG